MDGSGFFNDYSNPNYKKQFMEKTLRERQERKDKLKQEKELKEKIKNGEIIYKYYKQYKVKKEALKELVENWESKIGYIKTDNDKTDSKGKTITVPPQKPKLPKKKYNPEELLWIGRVFCYLYKNNWFKSDEDLQPHTVILAKIYCENNILQILKDVKQKPEMLNILKQILWISMKVIVANSEIVPYSGQELIFSLKYIDGKYYSSLDDNNSVSNTIHEYLNEQGFYQMLNEILTKKMELFVNNKTPTRSISLWFNAIIRCALLTVEYNLNTIDSGIQEAVQNRIILLIINIFTVPIIGSILSDQGIKMVEQSKVIPNGIKLLNGNDQLRRILFNILEGERTFFLIANITKFIEVLHLISEDDIIKASSYSSSKNFSLNTTITNDDLILLLTFLALHCQKFIHEKNTGSSLVYHPIFNWYSGKKKEKIPLDLFKQAISQISFLWSVPFMLIIFKPVLNYNSHALSSSKKTMLSIYIKDICNFYLALAKIIGNQKDEIFNSIAYLPNLIPMFWCFMNDIGPKKKLEIFINAAKFPSREPLISILEFFCRSCSLLFLTLDDQEIYDLQKPFSLISLKQMSLFLNNFCFQMYWQESAKSHREILEAAQLLLNILYDKNDRRPFSNDMDWTVKEIRHYTFLENIKKKDEVSLRILESMPHVIPFKIRVEIFREYIKADKDSLVKLKKKEFSIRRTMILEDGFEQLGHLNTLQFKQTIRIKFISAHGYEEAGIDQNGVFKEFLEELCKAAFDPALNLFKTTTEGYCSPSPTSYIQENYLAIFEFIGKILGKALYEAIVIDFPFAQFFYAKLLSRFNTLDDLPSLDPQLYKNLTFLKHYEGNCEDLGLTFTVDQDVFGKISSIDIKPGGSHINVTNENRYQYIYLVADYMLNQQCKEQNRAFIKGFKSIISEKWLQMFSPAELQKLISGESVNIDINDLRKYAKYEGGYFDQHKTIRNLWSVLEGLSEKEKQLFLKFTTSCSKPPVGGFEYLNPPLTIRYVPMDDDGNVEIKPFEAFKSVFGLAKDTTRLPTASTCFNLLK